MAMVFEGVCPILRVQSVAASVDYYVKMLGFKVDWDYHGIIASVSRDRCGIFLSQGDQGNPGTWVWIGVSDVEALFAECCAKGAKIRQSPTNFEWACEMQVEDLDGNVLRLGSEPKTDRPFGPWLDMHGGRWRQSAEGTWSRVEDHAS
jgi:predicted enzyme related to lactoylglutathione lyase